MPDIRVRPETGLLYFDFQYLKVRCREQSTLVDTPENRKIMERALSSIMIGIKKGTFRYRQAFPASRLLSKIEPLESEAYSLTAPALPATQGREGFSVAHASSLTGYQIPPPQSNAPLVKDFAHKFVEENRSLWKRSNIKTKVDTLEKWVIPHFGDRVISSITKQDILEFRSVLAKAPGKKPGSVMSPSRINHVMTALKQVLDEAADRFNFTTPYQNIKRMRIKKTDVTPFAIEEVEAILQHCRADFRNYFAVKFFTGMRPGEIHGLKWKYVNFEKRIVTIRETVVEDYEETPKTEGSNRDIQMVPQVFAALKAQWEVTGKISNFVFCNSTGGPLNNRNMADRVWYPMLRSLNLPPRTPYQTRHTFATLMLAAGETPEWIAYQMGHSTTEMLFRVYSRYVPNLTRRDGSAFERMLASNFGGGTGGSPHINPPIQYSEKESSPKSAVKPKAQAGSRNTGSRSTGSNTASSSASITAPSAPTTPPAPRWTDGPVDASHRPWMELGQQLMQEQDKGQPEVAPLFSQPLQPAQQTDQSHPHSDSQNEVRRISAVKNPWAEMFESYQGRSTGQGR